MSESATYLGEAVRVMRPAPHDHLVIRYVRRDGRLARAAQCVPAHDVKRGAS